MLQTCSGRRFANRAASHADARGTSLLWVSPRRSLSPWGVQRSGVLRAPGGDLAPPWVPPSAEQLPTLEPPEEVQRSGVMWAPMQDFAPLRVVGSRASREASRALEPRASSFGPRTSRGEGPRCRHLPSRWGGSPPERRPRGAHTSDALFFPYAVPGALCPDRGGSFFVPACFSTVSGPEAGSPESETPGKR